jgi:hypothetical protein
MIILFGKDSYITTVITQNTFTQDELLKLTDDSTFMLEINDTDELPYPGIDRVIDNKIIYYKKPLEPFYDFNKEKHSFDINNAALINFIKQKRNDLLLESDWTQLPDVPLTTKEAWATYRQALRDITSQEGYPTSIAWPVAP